MPIHTDTNIKIEDRTVVRDVEYLPGGVENTTNFSRRYGFNSGYCTINSIAAAQSLPDGTSTGTNYKALEMKAQSGTDSTTNAIAILDDLTDGQQIEV